MGVGVEPLERFLDAAKRLAEASGLRWIEAGLVSLVSQDQTIALQFRARLVQKQRESREPFRADGIRAWWATGPMSGLDELVQQVAVGTLRSLLGEKVDPAVVLTLSPGAPWNLSEDYRVDGVGQCLRAACPLAVDRSVLSHDVVRAFDRTIAKASDHRIASLARLGLLYTGKPIEVDRSAEIEFLAPRPMSDVQAMRRGRALRLQVEGLAGLDPKRFIVNLEGKDHDRRFDSSSIEWAAGPSDADGTVAYVGTIEDSGPTPVAVNVYFADVDEVALRETVRDEGDGAGPWVMREVGVAVPRREPLEGTRVSGLHAEFFRCLRFVDLDLTPLTVVVGPNQAGKSTLLEVLDVLASAARADLYHALMQRRGGLERILWRGPEPGPGHLGLGAGVRAPDGRELRYAARIGPLGSQDYSVELEQLHEKVGEAWRPIFETERGAIRLPAGQRGERHRDPHELLICQEREIVPETEFVRAALASVAVFPFFQTGAGWSDGAAHTRMPAPIEPHARLSRNGANLSAALHAMSAERPEDWKEYVEIVKLAFPRLKDIRARPVYQHNVTLDWYEEGVEKAFDASELSDGTLGFLAALCALFEPGHALVAIDEPERHLHPEALYRLVGAARVLSGRKNVLFTTQSDRLLGFLDETPDAVVVARRDAAGTRLVRPGRQDLDEWLKKFTLAEMRPELESWDHDA